MNDAQSRYRASEKGKLKHREHMRKYMNEWRKQRKESADYNPEEERRRWREQHQKVRERAMEQLGGKQCCNCGCDDFSILEINHINGGERKALKIASNRQLYLNIVKDRVNLKRVYCSV